MRGAAKSGVTLVVLVGGLAGCLGAGGGPSPGEHPAESFLLSFLDPVVLETQNGETGNEPSLAIARDGTVFVCAPRGVGRGTNVWRSVDAGATFERLGGVVHPAAGPRRSVTGDVGGGDCDLGVDEAGTAYLADLWVGGVSVAWTKDQGRSWDGSPVSQLSGTSDRPWILGGEPGEVFVAAPDVQGMLLGSPSTFLGVRDVPTPGGIWVARSTDGGRTFPQQVLAVGNEGRFPFGSNLAAGNGNLYISYIVAVSDEEARYMLALSKDRGLTWTHKVAAPMPYDRNNCAPYPTTLFPAMAADEEGGVYLVAAYNDPVVRRTDIMLIVSPDGGETWHPPARLTDRPGTRVFPWVAAAGAGRVGIAWYESSRTIAPENITNPAERATCGSEGDEVESDWFLHYAESRDATAAAPEFEEVLAQPTPVNRSAVLGRPFAEFLQVEFDPEGRAAIAYASDTEAARGRPMFVRQAERTRSAG